MENNKDGKLNPSATGTGTQSVVKTADEGGATTQPVRTIPATIPVVTEPEAPKANVTKSKKIEVDEDVLNKILSELSELKEKTNDFEKTASQDQIRKIEALRASGKLVKAVKIRRFADELVIGWKVTRDRVWVADKQLHEEQDVLVYLNNGTEVQTSLREFTRGAEYEAYEVIGETKTFNGEMEFTVMIEGGNKLIINSKYVN